MKTHVIRLDSHDDFISIRDKMSWAKSPRILLVWPDKGEVVIRLLDLRLLDRHSALLGARLGLVTRDPDVKNVAKHLGIPSFFSVSGSQKSTWAQNSSNTKLIIRHRPRVDIRTIASNLRSKDVRPRTGLVYRVLFFGVGVLAILVLVGAMIPAVKIELPLTTEAQEIVVPLTSRGDVHEIYLISQIELSQRTLHIESTEEVEANGRTLVPTLKASGKVEFRNLTNQKIIIPEGTVVLTLDPDPLRYLTLQKGEIPAGVDRTIIIPVEAEIPGSYGNIDADRLHGIEGLLGLSLAVNNPESISGGANREQLTLTEEDLNRAREEMYINLREQALSIGQQIIPRGDLLLPVVKLDRSALNENVQPTAESGTYSISIATEVMLFYIPGDELMEQATFILDQGLPEGYQGVSNTLTYEVVNNVIEDEGGNYQFNLIFKRFIHSSIDFNGLIQSIQGRNLRNAIRIINDKVNLTREPTIRIQPRWWPWLPPFSFQYELSLK